MLSCSLLIGLVLLSQNPQPDALGKDNPVYQELRTKGLTLDGQKVAFPAPSLPLDLPATAEKDELKKIVKADFTLADFVYTAVDAPSVKKTKFKKSPGGVIWQYDYWFIVYGPLKALDPTQGKDNPLEPQVVEQGDTRVITTILDPKTLAKFDIKPMKSAKSDESFISQRSELFGLVDVHATNHILATQEDDSWLIATHTDHRFDADPALANEWEPILDAKKGQAAKPKRQKSDGGGGYTKITSLKSVQGALLVESHFAYFEPKGWREAGSMLDAKMATIAKSQIRRLRDEIYSKYPLPKKR